MEWTLKDVLLGALAVLGFLTGWLARRQDRALRQEELLQRRLRDALAAADQRIQLLERQVEELRAELALRASNEQELRHQLAQLQGWALRVWMRSEGRIEPPPGVSGAPPPHP